MLQVKSEYCTDWMGNVHEFQLVHLPVLLASYKLVLEAGDAPGTGELQGGQGQDA